MKLLTHNMLMCNKKGVKQGYPLRILATKVELKEAEFNPEFIRHVFPKLEYRALLMAAESLGAADGLPPTVNPGDLDEEDLLRKLHNILLEIHIVEGMLVCPESGREFNIKGGIPNMLLREDEV